MSSILKQDAFANRILDWYGHHKRDLPWRDTKNPYIIWLSEIILQQTRVAQGLPYFERFLAQYPTLQELAAAPLDDIMRLWQGLGYYSRARYMHLCAIQVVDQYKGIFPDRFDRLIQLKGVGTYTAAAIASFAFDEPVAVVDGNVFRVMARYFGISDDINSSLGKKKFEKLANQLIPANQPGEYNQAIMEFGALQCVPSSPNCHACPLSSGCFAFQKEMVKELPVKLSKVKIKKRNFLYAHIQCGELVVLRQRGPGDIWQGLFDFPVEETENLPEKSPVEFRSMRQLMEFGTMIVEDNLPSYKHVLTHQIIFATFVKFVVPPSNSNQLNKWAEALGYRLVSLKHLNDLGKPRLLLKYLNGEK